MAAKREIVLTSRFALDRAGGIESAVREIARRIERRRPGWNVRTVHAFDRPTRFNRIPLLGDLIAALVIARRCRDAEVVLVNGAEYAWPRLLTPRGRKRTIVVWHGTRAGEIPALVPRMSFPIRAYLFLETWLQRYALHAKSQIAVSVSTIEELRRAYRRIPKVVLVPNGSARTGRTGSVVPECRLHVAWIGTVPYKKGLDIAIDACRILRSTFPAVKLVAIGPIPSAREATEEWIEWTGPLDHPSALARLERCGLFLGSTRYEGCSVAVIEALSIGLPVIASPSISWMIGGGGVAVADYRPESFANAIAPLLANETLRDEISEAAVARSRSFSWTLATDAYLREITSCLDA